MIISAIVFIGVAIIMIGIGFSQLKSINPVGFYSGEKALNPEELTDAKEWNRKHGIMWLIYGMVIIITWLIGYLIGDSIWCLIPFCGGIIVPVPIMILYHNKLLKQYFIKCEQEKANPIL